MAVNTEALDDGKYNTMSSLSLVGSRATLAAQDVVATSTLSVGGTITMSASTISPSAVRVNSGAAIGPTLAMTSEVSLGFYRSAASQIALSYGTFNATGVSASGVLAATAILISSATTAQSAASAKIPNQGQIVFSILSLTTNGAAIFYRSGNSVFGWPSSLVVG